MPSRLGLANADAGSLESLAREEQESTSSPYPTSLKNPYRQSVARPIAAAQATQQPTGEPAAPQQSRIPDPIPLNHRDLINRVHPSVQADRERELRGESQPWPLPQPAIVLSPEPVDVQEIFAAKESVWLPPLSEKKDATSASVLAHKETSDQVKPDEKYDPSNPSEEQPHQPDEKSEPALTSEELLAKLIASVEREILERTKRKEDTDVPALEQKLRLLQLVADRSDDAVERIDQLPPAEREAFKQLMFALSTWLSPDEAKRASLRNAKVLRTLQEVDTRLSTVSKLDLKNLTFCEKVESFGWFTEFPRAEFAPKQQVILYVEVQNFAAEEKTATSFETELQGSYQIFDAGGNIVDERQLPLDREVCRNFRRDYFLAYRIYLPGDLAPGRYRLELAIEDLKARQEFKGRKQGEAMIEFSIR